MGIAEALSAIWDIPWLEDPDDMGSLEIGLDLLATQLIRSEIVSSARLAHASSLSEVLEGLAERSDLPEEAVHLASTLEECLSEGSYGDYSSETVKRADAAREELSSVLEVWLESKREDEHQ